MSKRNRRILLWSSPLVIVGALALVTLAQVGHLQGEAERLAGTGQSVLRMLKEYGAGLRELDLERALSVVEDGYRDLEGGGWTLRLESDRDGVEVYSWHAPLAASEADREGLRARYAARLEEIAALELAKFKLNRIESIEPAGAVVTSVLWMRGRRHDGRVFETQARFRLWVRAGEPTWTVSRQQLLEGKTVIGEGRGFDDQAERWGLDFVARRNPLFATEEWRPKKFGILKYGSAGVSAADYDGDGWYDLFFADGAGSRLYRNQGGRSFVDVTASAGLPLELPGVNVGLFADLDNDGDQDLLLGRFTGPNLLFRNEGDGTFTDVTEGAGLGRKFVVVATAGDYDGDGDLDLYLGRYLDPRTKLPTTLFYTRNGEGNSLLRNDGDLRFTDVTEEAGVREGGLTLGVTWGDYDRDGDADLYVANDFGRNALLRNEGDGSFSDVSEEAGALDFGFGMSASFGDADNDGDLDLYISNVHSGQRWYGQATTLYQYLINSVRQGTIVEDFPLYREIFDYAGPDWRHYGDGMVKGNSLLLNDGDGGFQDVAEVAGANPYGWYWGSTFLDYDNDGRQDIYAANGWITAKSHDDL